MFRFSTFFTSTKYMGLQKNKMELITNFIFSWGRLNRKYKQISEGNWGVFYSPKKTMEKNP